MEKCAWPSGAKPRKAYSRKKIVQARERKHLRVFGKPAKERLNELGYLDSLASERAIMMALHPEYVLDNQDNRKAVMLPLKEWEQIVSELEALDDIRAYDLAKEQDSEAIPFEQAVREIEHGDQ